MPSAARKKLFDYSLDILLQPIKSLLDDPEISEVMINGPDTIFVEKAGKFDQRSRPSAPRNTRRCVPFTLEKDGRGPGGAVGTPAAFKGQGSQQGP